MNWGLDELKFPIYFLRGCVASQERTQVVSPGGVQMCLDISADLEGMPAKVCFLWYRGDFWTGTISGEGEPGMKRWSREQVEMF